MKLKEEINKINQSNKRVIWISALILAAIVLTSVLFNIYQSRKAERQVSEYQPPVRTGEPGFLEEEPADEEDTEPEIELDPIPEQSIFDRSPRQPNSAYAQPTGAQPQRPDRRRELYEEALASNISVGGEISVDEDQGNSLVPGGPSPTATQNQPQAPSAGSAGYQNYSTNRNQQTSQRGTVSFDHPVTPYTLLEGAMIEATLQTGVSSALPGNIVGIVNRDIYDSINQQHLIIPRGTRIVGTYESSIAFDQRKMMMSWQRLLFPDGRSMHLPSFPTHDLQGMSGLGGDVNTHFWSIFGQSAMLSMIGAGASLAISPNRTGLFGAMSAREIIAVQVAEDFQRVANQVMRRNMNRQPTIEIEAGTPFTIFILDDLSFEEPYYYTEVWQQE